MSDSRQVCKSLRDLVDERPPASKAIFLKISADANDGFKTFKASLSFDGRCVLKNGSVEQAMQGLTRAVSNPRTRLKEFKIHVIQHSEWQNEREVEARKTCFAQIKDVLSTMPRGTLDVEQLVMQVKNQDEMLSILPYMTPGVLESIEIGDIEYNGPEIVFRTRRLATRELIELEQWKRVKRMIIMRFVVQFPIQNITHFREAIIHMTSISMKQLQVLRDAVLSMPDFARVVLVSTKTIDIDSIDEHLGLPIPQPPESPGLYRRYPVPDSDDHVLEISILPGSVLMVRNLKTDLLY